MKRNRSTLFLLVLVLLFGGCAASAGGTAGARFNPNLISTAELSASSGTNMYDTVRQLRPNWLQVRGVDTVMGTPAEVVVYLDQTRFGGPESLRQIRTSDVTGAQYLNATDATNRFGTGHGAGAIVVTTR